MKKMKLSMAMLNGSKKYKSTKINYRSNDNKKDCRYCAIGVALAYSDIKFKNYNTSYIAEKTWPRLAGRVIKGAPIQVGDNLFNQVSELHRVHGWSRERIALWLKRNRL